MASDALGLLECKGLVCLMEGTDAMLKSANVEMIGWDKAGSGLVTAFVKGDVAAVKAAIDAGAEAAGRVGTVVSVHVIARPHDELAGMMPKKKPAATVSDRGIAIGAQEVTPSTPFSSTTSSN